MPLTSCGQEGIVLATAPVVASGADRWGPVPQIAFVVLVLAAGWLIGVGGLAIARPERARDMLRQTAATRRINLTEQGLRLLAGIALIVRAPYSKLPMFFEIGGGFVVASSILLLILPLRWHAGYAIWWAERVHAFAVRAVGFLSIIGGAGLIYAAW
jgi:hypothetical protein